MNIEHKNNNSIAIDHQMRSLLSIDVNPITVKYLLKIFLNLHTHLQHCEETRANYFTRYVQTRISHMIWPSNAC